MRGHQGNAKIVSANLTESELGTFACLSGVRSDPEFGLQVHIVRIEQTAK